MRWVINPIEFLRRALKLPAYARAGCDDGKRQTTVDGAYGWRRLCQQGRVSGCALCGRSDARPDFQEISVSGDRIGHSGRDRRGWLVSGAIRRDWKILRARLFALPQVEIASHSFSHPFYWRKASKQSGGRRLTTSICRTTPSICRKRFPARLPISIPDWHRPDKKVKVFLWTGDCNIGADALALAYQDGVHEHEWRRND